MIFGKYFYGVVVLGSSLLLAQNAVFSENTSDDIPKR
jgi:hypothetical protein